MGTVCGRFRRDLLWSLAMAVVMFLIGCTGDANKDNSESLGDPDYPGIAMGRARHAVQRAQIDDPAKAARLQKLVGDYNLAAYNNHQIRDAKIAAIRAEADSKLAVDRDRLISALEAEGVTPQQLAAIKDGMTHNAYNVVYRQYEGYRPPLTAPQKREVRRLLTEARDQSMLAGSAPEKIDVFNIQYRAKINAWLMTQGYDIATAKKEYDDRIAAERAAATQKATTQPIDVSR